MSTHLFCTIQAKCHLLIISFCTEKMCFSGISKGKNGKCFLLIAVISSQRNPSFSLPHKKWDRNRKVLEWFHSHRCGRWEVCHWCWVFPHRFLVLLFPILSFSTWLLEVLSLSTNSCACVWLFFFFFWISFVKYLPTLRTLDSSVNNERITAVNRNSEFPLWVTILVDSQFNARYYTLPLIGHKICNVTQLLLIFYSVLC